MDGQGVFFALLLVFLLLPVWQAFKWQLEGKHQISKTDVAWLVVYVGIGFSALLLLRDVLLFNQLP